MTDASDASSIMDVFARGTLIIQKASDVSVQCRLRQTGRCGRRRTNTHADDTTRPAWRTLQVPSDVYVASLSKLSRLTFVTYFINPCRMMTSAAQPAAALPAGARPSLLLGDALPRRRSLLLPERARRGRARHVQAREVAIAAHLAALPAGSAVTVREVLSRVPGLRLVPGQEHAVQKAMTAAGWCSGGRGRELWTRLGDVPAQRLSHPSQLSRWHPAVARRMDRIAAFLSERSAVTAEEVAHAVGISLPGQRQRCVARALARLGFTPPGRGGRVWKRSAPQ